MRRLIAIVAILAALAVTAMLAAPPGTARAHASQRGEYVFGRNALIDHPVKGDVQVYAGSVTVRDVTVLDAAGHPIGAAVRNPGSPCRPGPSVGCADPVPRRTPGG